MGNIYSTFQHETKLYNMFSNNNVSKNVHQTGSRKTSLQDRENEFSFPPSKKPRRTDSCTSRQVGVEDDIWGDDLDANSVEECFLLATQALSQTCVPEASRIKEQECAGESTKVQQFKTRTMQPFKSKPAAAFTRNALSTSKWTEIHSRKTPSTRMPSNVLSKSGPQSAKHPEMFSEDFKSPSVTSKSKHMETLSTNIAPSMAQVEVAQRNTVSICSRTSSVYGPSSSSSFSTIDNINTVNELDGRDLLVRELQQLRLAYQKLQDHVLAKEGEVAILRAQLNSKNAEIETERLTKAQEIESKAQEFRDKMKDLQKELEHMKTQLDFKTLEVDNAWERSRLLESQSKVKLVEPQNSQIQQKFPKKLPMLGSTSASVVPKASVLPLSLKPMKSEICVSEGPMLSRLVTPALFEKSVHGTDTISCLNSKQQPVLTGEYGKNLTPRGSAVNVTHGLVSKLVLLDTLEGDSAQQLIQKVVWRCYLMLVKQRDLLKLHKPPQCKDKLKDQDLKVSMAAGSLFGDKASLMSARPLYKNEQGLETRRALGLMGALAMVSQYAAEYMSSMILREKFVTVRKVEKKKCPQGRPVHMNWLEHSKTVQSCKLKPAHMSNTVRKIVEQRILTNMAISRAKAGIRAAKFVKSKTEAQQATVELEQDIRLSEYDNPVSSKGSRRPPNPLVVYKKYLEKRKAASQAKVKQLGQESSSGNLAPVVDFPITGPGPSSLSNPPNMMSGHTFKYNLDAHRRKVSAGKDSIIECFSGKNNESESAVESKSTLRMKGMFRKMKKIANNEQESVESEEYNSNDQLRNSKVSDPSDELVFKKPFPVKQKAQGCKTTLKEGGKNKVKIQNKKNNVSAVGRKLPLVRYLHPSVLAYQNKEAARVMKLLLEKGHLHMKKENVRKKHTVDLFETLHNIVLFICDQRLSLKFNGVLLGVTHLLRVISCKVEFKEDRCPVLARIVRDMILCRPSVNVLMELTDLLFSLGKYRSIMETLCCGTGPSPYLGGTIGVVYFVKGKPQYDLGSNEEVEYFGRDSCMIPLLCWMLLVQRATINEYVVLASNVIKWLVCVSRQQEEGPNWIGSNDSEVEVRDCQCRARVIEAAIMLLHLCYLHIRKTDFQDSRLFRDIRHLLGRGLIFFHRLVHQDADVGLLMANAEGEYQVLIHGLIENLQFMNLSEQEEEALKVLKELEDQQDMHNPPLKYTEPATMVINNIFETMKSFFGPSYK